MGKKGIENRFVTINGHKDFILHLELLIKSRYQEFEDKNDGQQHEEGPGALHD